MPDVNFREIVLDYYPKLYYISKHFAEKLKIDEGQVFFFSNYTSSANPRDIYKEYMGLYILDKAIEAAKSKIESLYSNFFFLINK